MSPRQLAVGLVVVAAACRSPRPAGAPVQQTGYHFGPTRQGWNDTEAVLTPAVVKRGLRPAWSTAPFDTATDERGVTFAAHAYAAPLYVDGLTFHAHDGSPVSTSAVFVATSSGWAYAIATLDEPSLGVSPGARLWSRQLCTPLQTSNSDGAPLGVLATPVIDLGASPPRLYVTCADRAAGWQAFALDLSSGATVTGWPLAVDTAHLQAVDRNVDAGLAPPVLGDTRIMSQRGALALSPSGDRLYFGFGSYSDGAAGWMLAIDTATPAIVASFSGAQRDVSDSHGGLQASAGMWGAGGPAVDAEGRVAVTTGNSPSASGAEPGTWGNSLLGWTPDLHLEGTYSPFDYCSADIGDADLAGASPIVVDLDPATTSTPKLYAFGSKAGNVYLLPRDMLPGVRDRRPPCVDSALPSPASDSSLLAPDLQPYFTPPSRGPLNVFGFYSEVPGNNEDDMAKMRSTLAFFRGDDGRPWLFATGSSRLSSTSTTPVGPSLARLAIVTAPGAAAFLRVDQANPDLVFKNPGAPVVTSHAGHDAVVWVLDENGLRSQALVPDVPHAGDVPPTPVLYAVDALTLQPLTQVALAHTGGKYSHPAIAHGVVYVATDRLEAFVPAR